MLSIGGIKIAYTKKISQGNASFRLDDLYLGSFAYVLGGILVIIGLYTLYYCYNKEL
jgi:hypothetical protein